MKMKMKITNKNILIINQIKRKIVIIIVVIIIVVKIVIIVVIKIVVIKIVVIKRIKFKVKRQIVAI